MSLLTGILKPVSEATNRQPASGQIKGILKSNNSQQMKPKGILKTENAPVSVEKKQMPGILKKESEAEGCRRGMHKMESRLDQLTRKESSLEVKTLKDGATFGELTTDQSTGVLHSDGRFEALPQQTVISGAMDAAAAAAAATSLSGTMEMEAEADESSSASDPTFQNRIKNKAIARRRQQLQRQLAGR